MAEMKVIQPTHSHEPGPVDDVLPTVVAELQALYDLDWRGGVFVVDEDGRYVEILTAENQLLAVEAERLKASPPGSRWAIWRRARVGWCSLWRGRRIHGHLPVL